MVIKNQVQYNSCSSNYSTIENLIATAPTGSYKTCGFALPTLQNLQSHQEGQLYKEFKKLNKEFKMKYSEQ